ncbi:hypothetical protein HN011_007080 [Eciton burchellii]|nr:hypothetical protein HN011_007080 [Eciton burchellii]
MPHVEKYYELCNPSTCTSTCTALFVGREGSKASTAKPRSGKSALIATRLAMDCDSDRSAEKESPDTLVGAYILWRDQKVADGESSLANKDEEYQKQKRGQQIRAMKSSWFKSNTIQRRSSWTAGWQANASAQDAYTGHLRC